MTNLNSVRDQTFTAAENYVATKFEHHKKDRYPPYPYHDNWHQAKNKIAWKIYKIIWFRIGAEILEKCEFE